MPDRCSSHSHDDAGSGTFGSSLSHHEHGTYSAPSVTPAAKAAAESFDPSAALFGVMRATYWATGEELLQRLVSSLAGVLDCRVALGELVTAHQEREPHGLGLWIADNADAFRYAVMTAPAVPARDDTAIVEAMSRELGWDGPRRAVPVRSPSGRPLGQLLLCGAPSGGRFGTTLLDAVLLAPLAARAGAELARLRPEGPQAPSGATGPGQLVYMCAWCKSVRDARHSWHDVEAYIRTLTDAAFTHGICPDCAKERV
jgi:hypothetical protein